MSIVSCVQWCMNGEASEALGSGLLF